VDVLPLHRWLFVAQIEQVVLQSGHGATAPRPDRGP
jgi:hypothetical protein